LSLYLEAWIRIRIKVKGRTRNPDPHQRDKQDPDPHQSDKQDPDPHHSDEQDPDRIRINVMRTATLLVCTCGSTVITILDIQIRSYHFPETGSAFIAQLAGFYA
jgi:hypothetical protein